MTQVATRGFERETFESCLSSRQEPDFVSQARRAAWQAFEELPWPHAGLEEWRRTDVRTFRLEKFSPPLAPAAQNSRRSEEPPRTPPDPEYRVPHRGGALLTEGVDLGGRCAALDSHAVQSQLEAAYSKKGVLFGPLDELLAKHPELLRGHFQRQVVSPKADRFAALHHAFWTGGTLLYVPKGVALEKPLHTFSALTSGGVDLGRQLIVLEEGAEATLLAETAGGGELGLHCGAVEIILAPGSRLRYVNLQNWDHGVWHFAHHKAILQRDASLQWTIGALGSRLSKVNQHVALAGPGASAQVNGVMFAEGRQHLSYHTLQHHEAPHCKSDLLYKGALQDHSRLVWRGMIQVNPGAEKTDGYQRNDNLMLSEHSRVDSIPGLEILADDVRCTHGATTGRVDDEVVFYARCRGLTRNEAVRMIVAGFFQQVFDRITIESVREALGHAIGRRIRNYD